MANYLIQVILFQLVFLLLYEILLKKETFFSYNRWFLLLSPVIALILPFLSFGFLSETMPTETFQGLQQNWLPEVVIGDSNTNPDAQAVPNESNPINWWLFTYLAGMGAAFSFFIYKFYGLMKLKKGARMSRFENLKIYQVENSNIACTFFNSVFLGEDLKEDEREQIMKHEQVHIRQKHSLDLLFFEIFKILFWFNPLIYIYQSRLATLHEFIADENAVKTSGKKQYYEQLLNTAFGTQNISFINQFFNHSLIKKRILMLQKNKSRTISKLKYLIVVPLMLVMLTYVACSEDNQTIKDNQETSLTDKMAELEEFINNKESLTKEEKAQFLKLLKAREELRLRDGSVTPPPPGQGKTKNSYDEDKIPFAIIEEVPIFPGCADLASNEARKDCMSGKITQFVTKNFNTDLGEELGLTGTTRVIVQFRIDEKGNIQDVRSRAPAPELEDEAERVINSLPQMQPGKQDGKAVGVMYSLPIAFKINE